MFITKIWSALILDMYVSENLLFVSITFFFSKMFTFSNSPFHLSKYHTTKSTLYICVFSQYVKAITLSLCALWKLAWPMEPIYQQRASLQPRIYHTVCHTICTQWAVKGNIQTHIIIGDSSDLFWAVLSSEFTRGGEPLRRNEKWKRHNLQRFVCISTSNL